MDDTEAIKQSMLAKPERPSKVKDADLLSTGVTALNLALSGRPRGGIAKGSYLLLAGDSDSGKSVLARTILAEAAINKEFDKYRLIYNDPEYGTAMMDIRKMYGPRVAKRVEERHSKSLEGFYDSTDEDCEDGRPFIQIVDSMDALQPLADEAHIKKERKARANDRESSGSYGVAKARINAQRLRILATTKIARSKSILIIVAQLHDNIGNPMAMGDNKKSISGGKALKYYAHTVIWTGTKETLRTSTKIKGKVRELGILSLMKVKKNRLTGKKRQVEVPIYHSSGIDDCGAMVDYLVDEGHWKGTENQVAAPEFDFPKGSKEDLIKQIQFADQEGDLQDLVTKVFHEIENACKVERKSRYG